MISFAKAQLIPDFFYVFEWPQDISDRRHNQFAKVAMRKTMERHHEEHIPRHFRRENTKLYDHKPRKPQYVRYKQRRWGQGGMDLVKRGRTRQWMTSAYKLTVGGSASDRTLNATLKLTFPFKGGSGRFRKAHSRGAITIRQMIHEMQTFANDEPAKIVDWFLRAYMEQVDEFRSTRKRVRTRG